MAVFHDPSGREPSHGNLALRGVALLILGAIAAYLLISDANGDFSDHTSLTINTDAIGDGLKGGSDVKYLGFTVGEVSSIAVRDRGAAVKINLTGSGNDLVLRQGMTVNYTSSNALGPTALEIVDPGQGPPIGSGGSVYVSRLQSEQTSVSTLVRKISTLVEALDQPSFEAVVRFIVEDSQAMADSGRLVLQIAQLTRDVQNGRSGRT